MNYLVIKLSAQEVSFARFREKGKGLILIDASFHATDIQAPFASLMPQLAAQSGRDDIIILSIPSKNIFLRQIEVPLRDRRKIREILSMELKGETALETEELVFEALPLEENKVWALWSKKKTIHEKIQSLSHQGLEPSVVTASLFHWQHLLPAEAEALTIALCDGESLAVYQKSLPVFFHPLDPDHFLADMVRTLGTLEINRGIKVDQVYLHGKVARQDQESLPDRTLERIPLLSLPINAERTAVFSSDEKTALEFAGLYALAKAVSRGDPIDFRRGDLSYTAGREKARKRLRLPTIFAGILGLLLLTESGLRYFFIKQDLASINTSISTHYREIFPSRKKPMDEVAEIRSEIKRLRSGSEAPTILPLLKRLAELKGDEIKGFYETEIEGNQIRLKGDARSMPGIIDFKTRAASFFNGTDVGEMISRPDGSVGFVFRATVREASR